MPLQLRLPHFVSRWSAAPGLLLAQSSDGIFPEDPAARVVFVVVGAVIVGLYLIIRRTRTRAYDEYWDRRRREQERRNNDPDMRRDDA